MQKPRVLMIGPPIYDFASYDLFMQPYGLLRIAAWLKSSGYEVHLLDCLNYQDEVTERVLGPPRRKANGTGKLFKSPAVLPGSIHPIPRQYHRYGILTRQIVAALKRREYDLVCVTSGMTYWYEGLIEVCELVRLHAPRARLVIGGIYASLMPGHCRKVTSPDALITGDADSSLPVILSSFGLPEPETRLPDFPSPAPELYDRRAAVIRLNTGCPLSCDYCASDLISPTCHSCDPIEAAQHILKLRRRFGTRHVGFYDDALLLRFEQVLKPFLEHLWSHARDWEFYTPNAVHIRYITREVAQTLRQRGFRELRMGYESSSQEFHQEHDRKFQQGEFHDALGYLKEAGFSSKELSVYVLAGLPGQHHREVLRSIDEVASCGIGVSVAEFSPVPGTPAFDQTIRQCQWPLMEEPLYQNNSFQPTAWEGFTRDDMALVKRRARETRLGQ